MGYACSHPVSAVFVSTRSHFLAAFCQSFILTTVCYNSTSPHQPISFLSRCFLPVLSIFLPVILVLLYTPNYYYYFFPLLLLVLFPAFNPSYEHGSQTLNIASSFFHPPPTPPTAFTRPLKNHHNGRPLLFNAPGRTAFHHSMVGPAMRTLWRESQGRFCDMVLTLTP